MRSTVIVTGDQLASALYTLGANFIMGGQGVQETLHTRPARLMKALAHPEYASHVRAVTRQLEPVARLTLQCYYSAAVWLARKYR